MLTLDLLKKISPRAQKNPNDTARLFPYLTAAMAEFEINSPVRIAAFLAQVLHESAEFRYMEEIASGQAYEGRPDLGNVHPGDGIRYKGRGPIQLTGRANYTKYSNLLKVDLVDNPKRAADLDVGFRIACCYWKLNGLNELADQGLFDKITKRINGGYNGKAQRDALHAKAKSVLGLT